MGGTPADEDMLAVIVSAAEWSADEEEEVCDLFCSDGQDVQQGRVVELWSCVVRCSCLEAAWIKVP